MADTIHDLDRPMRVRELAARLGLSSPHPIYRMIAAGQLRHSKLGRSIWVREADWRELMARCTVEPGTPRTPDPVRSERARRRQELREQAAGSTPTAATD